MAKLMVALVMMAVVAIAADKTLTNDKLRLGTFLVLGFFTMRIIFAYTRQQREKLEEQGK
jgi:positive regulator of sigma E activity